MCKLWCCFQGRSNRLQILLELQIELFCLCCCFLRMFEDLILEGEYTLNIVSQVLLTDTLPVHPLFVRLEEIQQITFGTKIFQIDLCKICLFKAGICVKEFDLVIEVRGCLEDLVILRLHIERCLVQGLIVVVHLDQHVLENLLPTFDQWQTIFKVPNVCVHLLKSQFVHVANQLVLGILDVDTKELLDLDRLLCHPDCIVHISVY